MPKKKKSNKRKAEASSSAAASGRPSTNSSSSSSSRKKRRNDNNTRSQQRGESSTQQQKSNASSTTPTTERYYGPPPTPDAVQCLIQAAEVVPPTMPLLVRISDIQPILDSNDSGSDVQHEVVEATATDDGDASCRVLLPASSLASKDVAITEPYSHLIFVNGFYVSSERGYHHHHHSPSCAPATIYLSDVEVLHTIMGEEERRRRLEVSSHQKEQQQKEKSRQGNGGGGGKSRVQVKKEADNDNGHQGSNNNNNKGNNKKKENINVRGGMAGIFFSKYASRLSKYELAGVVSVGGIVSTSYGRQSIASAGNTLANAGGTSMMASFNETKNKVDEMMARHSAMLTLLAAQDTGNDNNVTSAVPNGNNAVSASDAAATASRPRSQSNSGIDAAAAETYMSALREFKTSQLDRQNAGLTSNLGRADAANATLIKERHRSALDAALWHAENTREPLSLDLLCKWHGLLCGGGLHKEAGVLRKKSVRAGRTTFTPPAQVNTEIEKVLAGLSELEKRLVTYKKHGNDSLGPLLFAAAALFGIVDVHPFADGNGRTARLVANWALRRAGLPFPVNLLVTPVQRREYVSAIEVTRWATNLIYRGVKDELDDTKVAADYGNGDISIADISSRLGALRTTGCFSSLVCLLADRVSRAYAEFRREEAHKANLASEEAEARAARRDRERNAAGDCIICFSEKPNIATLCCGKAVHLNCIAEWLGSNESCPVCRQTMPRLETTKTKRPTRPEASDEENTSTTDAGDDEGTTNSTQDSETAEDTTHNDTTTSEDQDDTTTEVLQDQEAEDQHDTTSDHDTTEDHGTTSEHDTTQDQDTAEDQDTTEDHETEHQDSDTTTTYASTAPDSGADTTSTTSDEEPERNSNSTATHSQQHRRCNCGNRNAIDCTNDACGRCCLLYGTYACARHNA